MVILGPTVLFEGTSPIVADIVFVHGLRGDSLKTWTKDNTVWPRDFLPVEVENARIITWGYDADVMEFFEKTSQSSISSHALTLLQDIQSERRTQDEKHRPLIFVGHSLGGLVVKQALCKSHEYHSTGRVPRIAGIFKCVFGVIFIGTPHRGSEQTSWATIATNLAKLLKKDHNDRIIGALTRGSEVLEGLQDSFAGILEKFTIYTVLEEKEVSLIGKIVSDSSASLAVKNEITLYIPANHMDMCKFSSTSDIGYRRLSGALRELVEDIDAASTTVNGLNESAARLTLNSTSTVSTGNQPPTNSSSIASGQFAGAAESLCEAVQSGDISGVRNLIASSIDIRGLLTPVPCFTYQGLTKSWMEYWGINTIARTMTALHRAVETDGDDNRNVLRMLVNVTPTPLLNSVGHVNIINAINTCRRTRGRKVLAPDDNGEFMQRCTVLTWAAMLGNVEAVKLLTRAGADVNSLDNWLRVTPLMAQCLLARRTAVALVVTTSLLEAGALVDLQDKRGNTALHLALYVGNSDIAFALLNAGASVNIANYDGLLAYDICILAGSSPEIRSAINARRFLRNGIIRGAVTHDN